MGFFFPNHLVEPFNVPIFLLVAQVVLTTRRSGRSETIRWCCCGKHPCMKAAVPSPAI